MELFITITPSDTFIFTWALPLENEVNEVEQVSLQPFLAQLVRFLESENKSWSDVKQVIMIFGGERFSVARIVVTVVNTLSLVHGFGVRSLKREDVSETTSTSRYALPLYKYPPHIGIKKS